MATLEEFLRSGACDGLLPWSVQRAAMQRFALGCPAVEAAALGLGLLPVRYQRNLSTVTAAGQARLLGSVVAVIGCGGLGGHAIELLARLGVGRLVVIDPDRFEEHNLNRQLLSTIADVGTAKVDAAVRRVAAVNPAVVVVPVQAAFRAWNGAELLAGVDLVIDALDTIPHRLELAAVCRELHLPLIHGAIGGWWGQVATQPPGHLVVERIYAGGGVTRGAEQELGNPSFTAAAVASLQVAEACKLLLTPDAPPLGRRFHVDLSSMEIVEIPA